LLLAVDCLSLPLDDVEERSNSNEDESFGISAEGAEIEGDVDENANSSVGSNLP
jgi:hypothetical protein